MYTFAHSYYSAFVVLSGVSLHLKTLVKLYVSTLHMKISVVPSGVVLHQNKLVEVVMSLLVPLGTALHLKRLV